MTAGLSGESRLVEHRVEGGLWEGGGWRREHGGLKGGSGELQGDVQQRNAWVRVTLESSFCQCGKRIRGGIVCNLEVPLSHSIVFIALAFKSQIQIFGDIAHKD